MYVQQWLDEDAEGLEVCGVRVDSIAVAAKVRRVVISAVILGAIEIGELQQWPQRGRPRLRASASCRAALTHRERTL